MGILSGSEIKCYIDNGDLEIMPCFDYHKLPGTNTIDLRLGSEFIFMRRGELASLTFPKDKEKLKTLEEDIGRFYERVYISSGQRIVIHPRELVLGITLEYIRLPDTITAYVIGRSSWGRLGLIIATATLVHPGFKGCITLELVNHGNIPLELYPGYPIAQISLHQGRPQDPYRGKYSGWVGPTSPEPSKIHTEKEIIKWML